MKKKTETETITFTINEFCKHYGFCRATYYRLRKESNLPPIRKIDRKCFIKIEDAKIWFEKLRTEFDK